MRAQALCGQDSRLHLISQRFVSAEKAKVLALVERWPGSDGCPSELLRLGLRHQAVPDSVTRSLRGPG